MTSGRATEAGTARYVSRFPVEDSAGFYRSAAGLHVSSLGLGTYLGALDEKTDDSYAEAVVTAVCGGVNFLDTAINYRHQRSERSIGAALAHLFASGEFQRDEVVVCTKAGFLTPGAVDPATPRKEDIVAGMHSMAPDFLAGQIRRSCANTGLENLDVFYLHNPETQLPHVSGDEFESRIRGAFSRLEKIVEEGKIAYYGAATWDGFRKLQGSAGALNLTRLIEIAAEVGGADHHFRFIQLPFNVAMTEAFVQGTVLEAAGRAGITVVASATLLQAKLLRNLPETFAEHIAGLRTNAQRAIQFTRSTPGISVALVGMSNAAHVRENLEVGRQPPLEQTAYRKFFKPGSGS